MIYAIIFLTLLTSITRDDILEIMTGIESELVSVDQLLKATKALKECVLKQNKNELFENDKVFLQFAVKKVGSDSQKVIKTLLPHGWVNSTSRICLFVKDINRKSRNYEDTIAAYEDLLGKHSFDINIDVYPMKKLKIECNDFESKRNLSNLYDVFLCDNRIMRLLPAKLGKHFIGRKKFLTQVNLSKTDLKEEILRGLRTSQCVMCNKGPSSQAFVGTLKHTDDELAANVQAVLTKIVGSIPEGIKNIRIASLKTEDSLSVPIIVSFENKDEVKVEKQPKKKLKRAGSLVFDPAEAEEISTVVDGVVTITPSGVPVIIRKDGVSTVTRKKQKTG